MTFNMKKVQPRSGQSKWWNIIEKQADIAIGLGAPQKYMCISGFSTLLRFLPRP